MHAISFADHTVSYGERGPVSGAPTAVDNDTGEIWFFREGGKGQDAGGRILTVYFLLSAE
jgi:hypothetical protein